MKEFTTPEYITPIIGEINAFYTPIIDKTVNAALNCNMLLQSNHTKNALVIRAGQPFYYYAGSPTTKELYRELKSYAEAAETYPGELDRWMWDEKTRIQNAIRDAILAKYAA